LIPSTVANAGWKTSPAGAPRVLYVSYDGLLEPLGAAQVLPYVEGLARHGFEIGVLSFEKPGHLANGSRCEALASRLFLNGVSWRARRYHQRPTVSATLLDVAVGAAEILRWSRCCPAARILHLRGYVPGLMALVGGRFHGAKLVFDTRSFMVDERIESGMWAARSAVARAARAIERRLLSTADAVVVVSRAGARRIPALALGAAPAKIAVIPPCVDLERFRLVEDQAARKAELGLRRGPVIVHAGALSTWYLAEYTFTVGMEFARRSGGTFLVLTHEAEYAHSLNTRLGAGATVRTIEHAEMPKWLGACDAGLAVVRPDPAKQGSMPVKLGEYLACGLAAAATGCVGDVERDLDGSLVALAFDPRSEPPEGIARRLLAAAALPDRAVSARSLAERLYSLALGVAAYRGLYEEIVSCAV
jgi:glycosyltransferase involved in cell wall biosynthesis